MLFEHKAQLYTKDNLIIVIAGKIGDKQTIIEQLHKEFGNIPAKKRERSQSLYIRYRHNTKLFMSKKRTNSFGYISARV